MEKIIETKYGKVEGIEKDGCIQFLGIPFAKKPIGDLAFRKPVAVEKWEGILKADKGSKNPIQHVGHTGSHYQSQDCLYMNIVIPNTEKKNLPVLVWIFGGSYAEGGAGILEEGNDKLIYDVSKIAKDTESIVVTFNYRLNLYGFLNLHFLNDRFDQNIGFFDQIMALKFVNENIGFFNGNSENVTLFGQSAGGACILALMVMNEAKSFFQKAIVMSACVEHFFTEEESRRNTKDYLKFLKIKKDELDKLLNLSREEVDIANKKFTKYMRFKKFELRCAFSPTIDGITLNGEPKQLLKNSTKPLLIGTVEEEANPFTLPLPRFLLFIMSKILKLKIEKSEKDYKHRISDAVTKLIYINPLEELLKNYGGDFWRYKYTYETPDSAKKGIGCYHFSDVPVLMGQSMRFENVDDEKSQEVGKKLRLILKKFAWESNPGWENFKFKQEIHILP